MTAPMNKDTAVRALLDKIETEAADDTPIAEYDIFSWSEQQADALRRRAAGELDWDNLAEEIEDLGRSELHACANLLVQAMRCMLKAQAWPEARDAPAWIADAIDFRQQAAGRFTPAMRQRINVEELYADALAATPATIDGLPPGPVTATCQWTLGQLLAAELL
jgi:hypothetical protein